MYCERVVSGKQCPKNTEQGAAFTNIFKNGQRQDFLKEYGQNVWKDMMSWKESVGSGKVWTGAW